MKTFVKKTLSVALVVLLSLSFVTVSFAKESEVQYCVFGLQAMSSIPLPHLSDADIDAVWAEFYRIAEAAVTQERIDEAARIRKETDEFFSNLTSEMLWESFLDEHPEILVLSLSENELLEVRKELDVLFEQITSAPNSFLVNAKRAYARHFSAHDGVSATIRTAIEAIGVEALAVAKLLFPNDPSKEDAYRHYVWNFNSVRSYTVGITQNGRLNSTRIYTTNYELAANIIRRAPHLNVDNPTDHQLALALVIRANFFNRPYTEWRGLFSGTGSNSGNEDLMDLWNNERGREDGYNKLVSSPLTAFNNRWDNGTLIRNYLDSEVTEGRRIMIWTLRWYEPVR
jgi:hypothetical protein